jgi:hypothetical protein
MKRPSSTSSAPSKKQKKSPRVSQSEVVVPDEELGDAQWEKVENRKVKKARKTNVKLDVCVSMSPARVLEQSHTPQANPPRFLYSNSEIIKRRDPVTINVLPHVLPIQFSCLLLLATRIFAILSFTS